MEEESTRQRCLVLAEQLLGVLDAHKGKEIEKIVAMQIAKMLSSLQETVPPTNPEA